MPAIFDHHLEAMADEVMALLAEVPCPSHKDIKDALASCWEDTAAITWTAGDIRGEYPSLSQDQARDVLVEPIHGHDASVGVSWNNLGSFVHRAVPDYSPEGEEEKILAAVEAFAEPLRVADPDQFERIFGSREPDFRVDSLDALDLRQIYLDWVQEDDEEDAP